MNLFALLQRSATAAAVALCVLATDAAAQSTSPRPLQRAMDEHFALLLSRAYDKLDRAAEEARAKQLSLSDGQPLLAAIYSGTSGFTGDTVNDDLWLVRKQRLDEWLKLKPDSTTARLSRAAFPVKYAWMARGAGYSNTVSPEGRKLFGERMAEGRKALEALDAKTRQDAGWYEVMLDVAMSQGWSREKYDAIFFEAIGKYPYYTPLYFARINYYSPRWYGTAEDARSVVEDAVKRTRSRWGETLYARLHWGTMDGQMFTSRRTDWPRMKAGFEKIVEQYPDPWNVNNFGKFACLAQDFRTLSTLLPKIGSTPIALAWHNDLTYYQRCRDMAASLR